MKVKHIFQKHSAHLWDNWETWSNTCTGKHGVTPVHRCISYFSHCWDQMASRNYWRKKSLLGSVWEYHEAQGYHGTGGMETKRRVALQGDDWWCLAQFLGFIQPGSLPMDWCPSSSGLWICPHRHSPRCVSQVILDPVKVTMKINHQNREFLGSECFFDVAPLWMELNNLHSYSDSLEVWASREFKHSSNTLKTLIVHGNILLKVHLSYITSFTLQNSNLGFLFVCLVCCCCLIE